MQCVHLYAVLLIQFDLKLHYKSMDRISLHLDPKFMISTLIRIHLHCLLCEVQTLDKNSGVTIFFYREYLQEHQGFECGAQDVIVI